MNRRGRALQYIALRKPFVRLLIGQGIMEFGDNFRLLAVTILLLETTGSGLAAGFSLVITPIVGILLSPFAGVLGDRLNGAKFLSGLYLLQGVLATLFIHKIQLHMVYTILMFFACIQIVQEPVFRKAIRDSLRGGDALVGNSLSMGMSGLSNLLGPVLGGIAVHLWDKERVLMASTLCYGTSALIVLFIKDIYRRSAVNDIRFRPGGFLNEIGDGIKYFWRMDSIRELGIAGFVLSFGTTSVSFAFYSLAFDKMGVDAKLWGFILSVFYSTRLLAMFISVIVDRRGGVKGAKTFYLPLFFTCLSWLMYGFSKNLSSVIIALIIEGTAHFLFDISLWTRLQTIAKGTLMARVFGINNIMSNTARVMGIILAFILIRFFDITVVFMVNGAIIFVYAFFKAILNKPGHISY
ncbi:MAG TPA: MFS transporter [Clostridia bacterium]|nr:MFS transporter [Clostridia bacterium]